MSYLRQDRRTPASKQWGVQQVNYPEGLPDFPEIVETKTGRKTQVVPAALTAHPDTANFPSAFLTTIHTDAGDNRDANWWLTYETLPGPLITEDAIFSNTGISILVDRQKVAASSIFTNGEFQPAAINVTSISIGATTTVTLASNHGLPIGAWVKFVGTNSTPPLGSQTSGLLIVGQAYAITTFSAGDDFTNVGALANATGIVFTATGTTPTTYTHGSALSLALQIVGVPALGQVQVTPPAAITIAGTAAGTFQALNRITRELKPTPNANVKVKVESMIGVPDVSLFNEAVKCWKDYSFPNFLKAINFYRDFGFTSNVSSSISHSYSWGGALGMSIQDGYRGPCKASRTRYFFVGPPLDAFVNTFSPTIIIASSGTFVIEGGSFSRSIGSGGFSDSSSNSFRVGRFPQVLTGNLASTTQTSGALVVGAAYTITIFAAGDNFSNVGASANASGIQFIATGTTPTTYSNGSTLTRSYFNLIGPTNSQARCNVDLPASSPTHLTAGDIITLVEQPQKLGVAGLWELVVWQLIVPYTSGSVPP